MRRSWQIKTRWVAHLLLLAGGVSFLFPFLWMLLTSVKTDEESSDGRWWPSVPHFRAAADAANSLELRALQLRSLDGHIFNLISGAQIAQQWNIESGGGSLVGGTDAARVDYRFADSTAPPLVLRYEFEMPVAADQLHKLLLSMKFDDSWHRLDATLDVGGIHWTSAATTWLAQSRPQSVILQPPGYDDTTYQPKDWVSLKNSGAAPAANQDRHATLRIILSPSSTSQAVLGKLERNFIRAKDFMPLKRYLFNSIVLVALTTIGALLSSTFVAYAFARLNWPGRGVAFVCMLATMMLPAQVTMIPAFVIWRKLGWYNTLNPMWVPAWFGGAFFIFLMTQHMKTLPRELEESARIDGLNALQTWWYIIVPQVKPAAAAIAILTFQWSWNEFMGPLIYLRDQSKFPLSLGLFTLRLDSFGDWPLIMAGNVLLTLPVVLIFFAFQRYFVQGMTMSGMKG
jgi:multiple sugar transport system permease protein